MRTAKALFLLIMVVAVAAGVLSFRAMNYNSTRIQRTYAATVEKANNNALKLRRVDQCFEFIGTSSADITNPAKWRVKDCAFFPCGSPKQKLCGIKILNPDLVYASTYTIVSYRNLPKVDEATLSSITFSSTADITTTLADFVVYYKPN